MTIDRAADMKRRAELLAGAANRCQLNNSYDMASMYRRKAITLLEAILKGRLA
jgi:hypothetical protein